MKKTFLFLAMLVMVFAINTSYAQTMAAPEQDSTELEDDTTAVVEMPVEDAADVATEDAAPERKGTQVIKKFFIDGGGFMFPVLFCLILGLAIAIEKIITLNMKAVNSKKLLAQIEDHFKKNDAEGAQEVARNTRGTVASIVYQAISRRKEGIESVEKSIVSYGSVQMGLLEKGLIWISLFIAIAPMLGFMGTVVGMIDAFDKIEQAGTISPSLVAGGIKIALLTTVGGLIVGVILQLFYNYLISKVDGIVNDMEDSSITLVDMMLEYGISEKDKQ
ncbi:MAG: MotA/TolQ/ExbB proton channel family protein [Bacteroidetes bacterium]|nr:MotA/TolQ/ExbB proton channel family protein [Bacteroidota bacterium]MBT5528439.1 MotA/TolQ/ExbB proton channel family protein [Cytophagia bacterium]MBT3421953.1 MotA/TolQ/ExbB proton channel family protein [Bacteroidota bacterium]MBT3802068.1 MotA/TolQ/ExbB proton channel family protein [Bacteroidota bacterium]MBT3933701.1 MotA/TolQ/ExbB proton channel family protein [Bacteroidota bacterium]